MTKKLNTVKIGDQFEDESYSRIIDAINDDQFAFPLKFAKVIKKAKYYSKRIEKNIIFDLSIEIWPPNSKNFSNVFIIECKSYSNKRVPIGDLRKFSYDVKDVAELNGKAVFISNSPYSEPSITFAKNTGMMLIEVKEDNSHEFLLHRTNRSQKIENNDQQEIFDKFIRNVFKSTKIEGLKKLSKSDIENITNQILNEYDKRILNSFEKYHLSGLTDYLNKKYDLKFNYKANLLERSENQIVGQYDLKNRTIFIDNSIVNTERFGFILAHEIGHYFLHSNLKMNQEAYDNFSDSIYDFESDKFLLLNDKNWVEWQANRFASSLLMPERNLKIRLSLFQESIGISRRGHIYVDNQQVNISDFNRCTSYLSGFFNVSKTSIIFRLQELKLITFDQKNDDYRNELRNLMYN